jgi:endonuclease/exonuclease/phosphatase family metal-dependent hydrolase
MKLATWNVNHRVGRTTFRPEAADAIAALDADVTVVTEYFPQQREPVFLEALDRHGLCHMSTQPAGVEKANRILIVSRIPLERAKIKLPEFDLQIPSNVMAVRVPDTGLTIVGVRIPWYEGKGIELVSTAWDWLENTAATLIGTPAIILGDLNVELKSPRSRGGDHFRRMMDSGWERATPAGGASYIGSTDYTSEIDHLLSTASVRISSASYVKDAPGFCLAGGPGALSDHAALVATVDPGVK